MTTLVIPFMSHGPPQCCQAIVEAGGTGLEHCLPIILHYHTVSLRDRPTSCPIPQSSFCIV